MKRIQVPKFQGVYYRESEQRKGDRCFDIAYTLPNGKLKWEKVGWTSENYTAQMAATVRGERIQALRHGEELPQKKKPELTFGELWKKYSEWMTKASAEGDRLRYERHLKKRFANKTLSEINPFDLERMKNDLLKYGLAPATVKHCLIQVRQVINKGIAWDLWQGNNPVRKVKLPKLNNKRARFLSSTEIEKLLSELKRVSPMQHDIALLSLHTGMRAGEIFALRWNHLNFQHGMIHIADPKSEKARKAYMTSTVREMLQRKLPARKNPEDLVFHRKGKQFHKVSRTFERAVIKHEFNKGITDTRQKVCFHTLRHTFASMLAIQGTPILTISELLGHSSLELSCRYAHLSSSHVRQAVNQLEQYLSEKEPEARQEPATA
ncbi:MAG: tyrosine-type recombinase/integrase [Syntrophobacteraceae bacterium]